MSIVYGIPHLTDLGDAFVLKQRLCISLCLIDAIPCNAVGSLRLESGQMRSSRRGTPHAIAHDSRLKITVAVFHEPSQAVNISNKA